MKSWEIERMIADEAREEGMLQGIQAYIRACREFSLSREETVKKMSREFPISYEEVEKYVNDNW